MYKIEVLVKVMLEENCIILIGLEFCYRVFVFYRKEYELIEKFMYKYLR